MSDSFFHAVINATSAGVCITDRKGTMIFVNKAFCNIYGYTESELIGNNFTKIVPDPFKAKAQKIHDKFVKSGKETSGEFKTLKKNGEIKIVTAFVKLLKLEDGQRFQITTTYDITDKHNKKKLIQREKKKTEALINTTSDFIWSVDKQYQLVTANEAFLSYLQELTGKTFKAGENLLLPAFFEHAYVQHWKQLYDKALKGELFSFESQIQIRKKSTETFMETKMRPILENDKIIGIACYARDITERKKTEEKLSNEKTLLRTLIDIIPDYIFVKDLKSRHLINNKANLELIGASTEEEALEKTVLELIPNQKSKKFIEDDLKVIRSKQGIYNKEEVILGKDGVLKWLLTTKIPLNDSNGEVMGLVGISRDISVVKQRELELRNSEKALLTKTRLLNTLAEVVKSLLYFENWRSALDGSLEMISKTIKADRAFFFSVTKDPVNNQFIAKPELEWTKEGVSRQIGKPDYHSFILNDHPVFLKSILKKRAFSYITKSLKETKSKRILEKRESKSILQVPVFFKDELYGYFCFDDCKKERTWSKDETSFLQTVSSSLAVAIERKNNLDLIKASFEEKNNILESIADGFFTVDRNWIVTYWNSKAESILSVKKEDILGDVLWKVFDDADKSRSHKAFREAMETKQPVHYDDYYATLDSWLELSAYPSENGLSVYFKDITEKKQIDEVIRESNERFDQVTKATNEAIWDWDLETDKFYWGEGFHKLFGLETSNITPSFSLWKELVHPDDLDKTLKKLYEAFANRDQLYFQNEYRFRKSDNTYAHVLDKGTIIRSQIGDPTRLVGAIQDITFQKNYEASLKQFNQKLENINKDLEKSNQELAASNQELEQFAYVASHDLQEPLRMITSFLSQIERKYDPILDEKGRKYIRFAVDGASRMREIILDLLEFSRVGRTNDAKENIETTKLLHEILLFNKTIITEKNAEIEFGDLPDIYGFKNPMQQLFQNLIINAIKYQPEGQKPQVNISAKETKEYWEFAVKDNGIGIDPEYHQKIFIIFQRLHLKEEYSGSGMGLAICKKIAELHNGKIWVNSSQGDGSTFCFRIEKPGLN